MSINVEALIESQLDSSIECTGDCENCEDKGIDWIEVNYGTHDEWICPKDGSVMCVG